MVNGMGRWLAESSVPAVGLARGIPDRLAAGLKTGEDSAPSVICIYQIIRFGKTIAIKTA